jgi:hypothetical protein
MIEKKAVFTCIDPYLLTMIRELAHDNNLLESEAIESILRVFFIKDELVEHTMINQTLLEQIEQLETKLQEVARLNQIHGEALESLERKLLLLEDVYYTGKIDEKIDSLSKDIDELQSITQSLIEEG